MGQLMLPKLVRVYRIYMDSTRWNFSNSEDLNNLAQGEYTLDIYNSENFCSSTQIIIVSEPDETFVDSELSDFSQYGVSCYGACDGYIEVDVFGGTGFELNLNLMMIVFLLDGQLI